jgi:hypothetical protein
MAPLHASPALQHVNNQSEQQMMKMQAAKQQAQQAQQDMLAHLHHANAVGNARSKRNLALRAAKESRTVLPNLAGDCCRMVNVSKEQARAAKRSRSSSALCGVQKDNSTLPKLGPQSSLPPLVSSQSTGALTSTTNAGGHDEIEQVLVTALTLNRSPGPHAAPQFNDNCTEMEAHLAKLLEFAEERAEVSPKKKKVHGSKRQVRIQDQHGDNENGICRKGTGFVHLQASAEAVKSRRVIIADTHGDNENGIFRKGTGFVNLNSLRKEQPSVWFPDITGGNANNIERKGTGYVFLNHVPSRVRIADSHGDNENRIQRKGTGFIDLTSCKSNALQYSGLCELDGPALSCASSNCMMEDHLNDERNESSAIDIF